MYLLSDLHPAPDQVIHHRIRHEERSKKDSMGFSALLYRLFIKIIQQFAGTFFILPVIFPDTQKVETVSRLAFSAQRIRESFAAQAAVAVRRCVNNGKFPAGEPFQILSGKPPYSSSMFSMTISGTIPLKSALHVFMKIIFPPLAR